jgi:hypothetical protein
MIRARSSRPGVQISDSSARSTLALLKVPPVAREPGARGRNLYDENEIIEALDGRRGQGARTDLEDPTSGKTATRKPRERAA